MKRTNDPWSLYVDPTLGPYEQARLGPPRVRSDHNPIEDYLRQRIDTNKVRISNLKNGTEGKMDGIYSGRSQGRLMTRAMHTKAGWVGQILLDEKHIVFEGKPQNDKTEGDRKIYGRELAVEEADAKLAAGFTSLFS